MCQVMRSIYMIDMKICLAVYLIVSDRHGSRVQIAT